jgi:EAL domain-containing protein (putative c-di-GMP-specific phosphodiesterase class I)
LLRIRHPQRGLLAPLTIFSALDDPRLANDIGIRMVGLVVRDMERWSAAGVRYGQVSINLATENLINPEFVDTLLALMKRHGVPATAIKLEITERVMMDDLGDTILPNLLRLRDNKIGLSLDDFGTGYASLVHLQTLPIDEIKIDRSFVSGLGTTNRGEIVQAMLGLAGNMGISAVAEGIETQGEALKLASWGCDFGQGFLFSRPMPRAEVASFLGSRGVAGKVKIHA